MTKRIFRAICLAVTVVFLAMLILFLGMLYSYFSRVQQLQLREQMQLAAQGVESGGITYLEKLDMPDTRVTWIAADGTVLFDSESDAAQMENHLQREEIRQALETGYGESSRYSTTLTERLLYSAQRLSDGSVLRVSDSHYSVLTLLVGMGQPLAIVILIAAVTALLLAYHLSKKIVEPLNTLNLDAPMPDSGYYEELTPLLHRIDDQQRQIRENAGELQRKKEEFTAVTENMGEGLLLLNAAGELISMNRAAAGLLDLKQTAVGQKMRLLPELLEETQKGTPAEARLELHGRTYQFRASPVISKDKVSGIVILMLDITEKEQAEQLRREFTANVSHELKTPLHAISGYAELLKNGMVQTRDVPEFSERIYSEAQRMICLVEDIIALSHLDEGAEQLQREPVELYALTESVLHTLQPTADAAQVRLFLEGEPNYVNGVRQLLQEIVFNLCDNAIKYNRKHGEVRVTVRQSENGTRLTVADTGIGIPPEHQQRIFERFYRVDKSHSKALGGTGLGLSIVKHAARLHDAVIELNSIVEKGTTVTVTFPA